MYVDLTIKNYRCFGDEHPARIAVRDGFTAIIGVNNSGKSTLLKMLYEFRDVFKKLSNGKTLTDALNGLQAFGVVAPALDKTEFFHNGNRRDLTIDLEIQKTLPRRKTGQV